ncbi:hypothetical protein GIB67_006658, partial [Kingdonia uniflora]
PSKVMNTLCPRAILKSEPGTTVAVHSNCLTTNIAVNRLINWDELSIPTEWVLPRVVPRPRFTNQVNQITQTLDGDVEVTFASRPIKLSLYRAGQPNSKPLEASAFAHPTNQITDVNLVIKQNNWTNVSLQTMGNQLNRIEDHIQRTSNINLDTTSTSSSTHNADIKPTFLVNDFKLSNSQDSEFVDLLVERIKQLSVNTLEQNSASEATSDSQSENHIQEVEASLHKIEYEPSQLKTYYKRPTPHDLLFEEDSFQNQISYNLSYACSSTQTETRTGYKCGKQGHLANKCATKRKLQELYLNEGLKLQLSKLLLNTTSEDSSSDNSEEVNHIDHSVSSSTEATPCDRCSGSNPPDYWKAIVEMNGLQLNTLTTTQSQLISIINKIPDPEIRFQILILCIQQLAQENPKPNPGPKLPTDNYYNFQDVLSRMETAKPITIQDLQKEINYLKSKIMNIKLSL